MKASRPSKDAKNTLDLSDVTNAQKRQSESILILMKISTLNLRSMH